jgi:cell wall-associated NlpC family hydrolase
MWEPMTTVIRRSMRHEARQRKKVVEAAYRWLATPYHHMGRLHGIGVDCAMLLAEVFEEAGVTHNIVVPPYPMQWHLHRDDERLIEIVEEYAREIKREEAKEGDIVLVHFGRAYSHGGIMVPGEGMTIIHAVKSAGCVILEDISRNEELKTRDMKFYSCWYGY